MKNLRLICLFTILISCNSDDEAGNVNINCTTVFVSGLQATITDAQTNAALTNDVTVLAKEGDYTETLMLVDGLFIGAGERAGTYSIIASAVGYMPTTLNDILVSEDECHVITEELTIALTPN